MAQRFRGDALERAVFTANTLYHDGRSSVRSIARQLGCSQGTADRLIVYSQDKWVERLAIMGSQPLHFEECGLAS